MLSKKKKKIYINEIGKEIYYVYIDDDIKDINSVRKAAEVIKFKLKRSMNYFEIVPKNLNMIHFYSEEGLIYFVLFIYLLIIIR